MTKKRTRIVQYVLLILLLAVLDLGVIHAYLSRHTEPQAVVIQEDPALAAFRYDVARRMGILTRSGCFNSTDGCLDYANEMIFHTEESLTLDTYRQYLVDGMEHLWQRKCIKHIQGCPKSSLSFIYNDRR